jgi:hypothetical protein
MISAIKLRRRLVIANAAPSALFPVTVRRSRLA